MQTFDSSLTLSHKLAQFDLWDDDQGPSWQRCQDGTKRLRVSNHVTANYLSLMVGEYPKKGTRREAYITLSPAAARALYLHLQKYFGDDKAEYLNHSY